jgi:hypothetical protein
MADVKSSFEQNFKKSNFEEFPGRIVFLQKFKMSNMALIFPLQNQNLEINNVENKKSKKKA